MRIRDRFGISERTQVKVTRLMELALVGLLFVGVYELNPGIVVNCAVGLLVVQLPAIVERDYEVPMDAALTLWITTAAFLHALGTVGLPGMESSFYRTLPVWDDVTHALSASVVAAVAYATVRAFDEHSESISLPRKVTFAYVLAFTMAFGVAWEVLEYAITLATGVVGVDTVLTQYSVEDTLGDLVWNTVGGLLVALWGHLYLTDVVGALRERLATNSREA
ncbi:hypothetical protein G9C85_03335 [Halorubellus sp. JP-L1]|uniref:hypothetical protein n=1 Tax=Halorubellus sp. JP-L1 TaxID=2715753 RepID=UPI00140D7BDF|nr:hypothetical protein [Halorubellus sp. JP-L1]NHN40670.1 hypothetical protein [Halorubellus sp. JP-L1]